MKRSMKLIIALSTVIFVSCNENGNRTGGNAPAAGEDSVYTEQHRPQVHFSPKRHWVNDPNGMVYSNGVYHLFFQYYPDSTIWGPMHWGHAISKDLVHWEEQPIALYPDSLGYIFSGSAVFDKDNTTGFGKDGKGPLVAIFTHHDPAGEKQKRNDFQNQSLAYSLDEGKTWTKYSQNPVLKNPGITDFRDPKVMWYEPTKKWIMTLAAKDRIAFYSSPDLKTWQPESQFGEKVGAHGGVWECPDLFTLDDQGKKVWVLIVNINPGGPNKGSATQYFLGDFDGKKFTARDTATRWLDYGPDEYAGITWANTGDRKIFLGWMSNWMYANQVPTIKWRNAMTLPRELGLRRMGEELFVTSRLVEELGALESDPVDAADWVLAQNQDLSVKAGKIVFPSRIDLQLDSIANFSLVVSNDLGEELIVGYDKRQNQYFVDRTRSGKSDFNKEFAVRHAVPRFSKTPDADISLVFDDSSVELFADDGMSVMTEVFFPNKPYDKIQIQSPDSIRISKLRFAALKSIWKK